MPDQVNTSSQIEDFKSYLSKNHQEMEIEALGNRVSLPQTSEHIPSLLRGIAPSATREELAYYIPSRAASDKLVSQFFSCYRDTCSFIHEPTFQKEYLTHWEDPTKTRIVWIGMLFAIFHLVELSFEELEDSNAPIQAVVPRRSQSYRLRTIQCLIAADYANPVTYTIETFILYIAAEWMSAQDTAMETSLVLSVAIRSAMRMGLHRDSSSQQSITPFQGEMRRRIWATIHQFDIIYSIQLGLPNTIRQSDCNSALPRNIHEIELQESMVELPPSRPFTEVTAISYTIVKYKSSLALERIVERLKSGEGPNPDDLPLYESALDEVKQITPIHLRVKATGEMDSASVTLLKQRISLDRVYQLGRCILYRKFLLGARRHPEFAPYRTSCINAAMTLLRHQATIYLDFDHIYPRNIKKRHLSTLTSHDFFIAGMTLAIDLYHEHTTEHITPRPDDIRLYDHDQRAEMITALETSTEFWRIGKDGSIEAAKAYGMFSFVLAKVKKTQRTTDAQMALDVSGIGGQPEIIFQEFDLGTDAIEGMAFFDWDLWNSFDAVDRQSSAQLSPYH